MHAYVDMCTDMCAYMCAGMRADMHHSRPESLTDNLRIPKMHLRRHVRLREPAPRGYQGLGTWDAGKLSTPYPCPKSGDG